MTFYLPGCGACTWLPDSPPALSSRTSCCPPGTSPSRLGNAAAARAAARHAIPVALAGCHAGPV